MRSGLRSVRSTSASAPSIGLTPINGSAPASDMTSMAVTLPNPVRIERRLVEKAQAGLEARRHPEIGHIHKLGDVEIDGNACQDIGLLAREPLRLDQEVDHVERGIASGQAHILRQICQRRYLLPAEIGRERGKLALGLEGKPGDRIEARRRDLLELTSIAFEVHG